MVHPVPEVFVTEKHVYGISTNLMNVVIILQEKQMSWDKTYSHGLMFNVKVMGKGPCTKFNVYKKRKLLTNFVRLPPPPKRKLEKR